MTKTQEELNELNKEIESMNNKLHELTEEELEQIGGGSKIPCRKIPTCPGSCLAMYSGLFKCPYADNPIK